MKKIKYEFADGVKEVEVSDEVADTYNDMIAAEAKVERKETRRHSSLERLSEMGMQFQDDDGDFDRQLEKEAREERERTGEDEKIARQMIRNEKRAIKKILTERQYIAFCYFTYENMSKVDIAKKMGITEGAVRKLLKKAELVVEDAYQKEIIL